MGDADLEKVRPGCRFSGFRGPGEGRGGSAGLTWLVTGLEGTSRSVSRQRDLPWVLEALVQALLDAGQAPVRLPVERITADRQAIPHAGLVPPFHRLADLAELEEEPGVGLDRGDGFLDRPLEQVDPRRGV